MTATTKSIQVLQIELGKRYTDREEKLEFISGFVGRQLTTSKELSQEEASNITFYLKTGKEPNATSFALFDRENPQHLHILSLAQQYGWVIYNEKMGKNVSDLQALGKWLNSHRSPIKKPLKQMNKAELSTVIVALESMIGKKFGR